MYNKKVKKIQKISLLFAVADHIINIEVVRSGEKWSK